MLRFRASFIALDLTQVLARLVFRIPVLGFALGLK